MRCFLPVHLLGHSGPADHRPSSRRLPRCPVPPLRCCRSAQDRGSKLFSTTLGGIRIRAGWGPLRPTPFALCFASGVASMRSYRLVGCARTIRDLGRGVRPKPHERGHRQAPTAVTDLGQDASAEVGSPAREAGASARTLKPRRWLPPGGHGRVDRLSDPSTGHTSQLRWCAAGPGPRCRHRAPCPRPPSTSTLSRPSIAGRRRRPRARSGRPIRSAAAEGWRDTRRRCPRPAFTEPVGI